MGRQVTARELKELPWVKRHPIFMFTEEDMVFGLRHKDTFVYVALGTPSDVIAWLEANLKQAKRIERTKVVRLLKASMIEEADDILSNSTSTQR